MNSSNKTSPIYIITYAHATDNISTLEMEVGERTDIINVSWKSFCNLRLSITGIKPHGSITDS